MFKLLSLTKPLHNGLLIKQITGAQTLNNINSFRFYSNKKNNGTEEQQQPKKKIPGKNKYDIVEGWDDPVNETLDSNFHISQKEPPKSKRLVNKQKKKRVSAFEVFLEEQDKSTTSKKEEIAQFEKQELNSLINENSPQGKLKKMMREKVLSTKGGKDSDNLVPESFYERDELEDIDQEYEDYHDEEAYEEDEYEDEENDNDELHQDFVRETELMEQRDILNRIAKEKEQKTMLAEDMYISNQIFSSPASRHDVDTRLYEIDEYKGEATAFNDDVLELDQVRVIDQQGKQMGIFDGRTAFKIAQDNKIDIILTIPRNPNVVVIGRLQSLEDYCKIQELIIERETAEPEIKLLKLKKYMLSSNIGQHDKIVKFNAIRKALDQFHPVEVIITFKTDDFDISEGEKMIEECKTYVRSVGKGKNTNDSSGTRMLTCLFNPLSQQEKEAYEKKIEADKQRELKKKEKLAKKDQLILNSKQVFEDLDGEEFIDETEIKKKKSNKH